MASPPNRALATSPVYPPHISLPNPKKRSSLSVTSQSSSKRRKPSSVSVSTPATSHPLRQTSFPPEESAVDSARSPSVESDVTGVTGGRSVVTAGTGIRKGKGRRRRKGEGSVKSGSKAPAGEEGSGSGHVGDDGAEEEEEDGEGEGDETLMDDGEKVDRAAEKKNLAVLVDAFNADQNERYNMFRRVKLKKETVRKIANQTLSQSVPPSVITTINGYTKVFIGSLVERAREIQLQHANHPPPPPQPAPSTPSTDQPSSQSTLPLTSTSFTTTQDPNTSPSSSNPLQQQPLGSQNDPPAPLKDKELGPLLPDHFREALRRYKRDGEGGGAGLGGLSLGLGLQGTAVAKLGGKRLFR